MWAAVFKNMDGRPSRPTDLFVSILMSSSWTSEIDTCVKEKPLMEKALLRYCLKCLRGLDLVLVLIRFGLH